MHPGGPAIQPEEELDEDPDDNPDDDELFEVNIQAFISGTLVPRRLQKG